MKKIFTISAAVLLLLLIFVYGYLQYRQHNSYKSRIHQDADLIFKIDLDGIISDNGLKFLRHPPRFLGLAKDSTEMAKGFSFPANVFVYSVRSRSAQTYFCAFPVSDSVALKKYFKKALSVDLFKPVSKDEVMGVSRDGKLTIVYNADYLAVSYSLKKENTETILLDLLRKKNLMHGTDARMIRLKEQKANFTYEFRGFSGYGNLNGDILSMNGSFPIEGVGVPEQSYGRDNFQSGAAIKIWLNGSLHSFLNQKFCVKDYCAAGDTLSKYYGGYVDFEMGHTIKQKDSVITYAYNDDFEKTEQLELKERIVPDFSIGLNGDSEQLGNYLNRQGIIDQQNKINKEVFPLYQMYSKRGKQFLQFSTDIERGKSLLKSKTPYFFFAEINFDQIRKDAVFPLLNRYLELLEYLKIKAVKTDEKKAHLEMEMSFSNR